MSVITEYTEQALAATGWAAIHLSVAMRLRPGLWGGIGTNALHDFGQARHSAESMLAHFPGARLYMVEVEGIGPVKVLARHPGMLAERIQLTIGLDVSDAVEIDGRAPLPAAERFEPKANDKLERLHALAKQEPPAHSCTLRREILAARAELESMGIAVAEPA
jgi:hypothetical protein